ncbi:MAG TPA: hypothetical protein VK525_21635 [Candidatus Saccharimonadales bacterium]|nr:hypothetical protein [Candidatus Saccharimonadales bacterium]
MELSEKTKRAYATMLRDRLRKRMPEHATRIDALDDDKIIALDREHTRRRTEAIRQNSEILRERARPS